MKDDPLPAPESEPSAAAPATVPQTPASASDAEPHASAHEGLLSGSPLVLSSAKDVELLVRAHGAMFLVTDRHGDIAPNGARELGLFMQDTRFLSHLHFSVVGEQLVYLSSDRSHDAFNQVDLMMCGREAGGLLDDPENYFHIRRRQLVDDELVEELVITSYYARPTSVELVFQFDADFADVFEVRGAKRPARGRRLPTQMDEDSVRLSYLGRDKVTYATTIRFSPAPAELNGHMARYRLTIAPGGSERVYLEVRPEKSSVPAQAPRPLGRSKFTERSELLLQHAEAFRGSSTQVRCSNGVVQQVLDQAVSDLGFLRLDVGGNQILAAGIPWFCSPFGRDSLLASYEALLLNPSLAKDSLRVLAAYQGKRFVESTEEEPGKIFHELRLGEMAGAGETPHSPYYGSIDATPLFVIVAEALYRITGDREFLEELRPALEAALSWIDVRSDNGTQLVSYQRRSAAGLDNQGWKDSRAAVVTPDGEFAKPPIALCEVQGYCVDAYVRGARLLRALGELERADAYQRRAEAFRAFVDERLWLPDLQQYAYAVDGQGRTLTTVVSNLGHLLWSRVPGPERASATADLLLRPESFSGFGIRTLAEGQGAYNPLSYHNGAVWPHDNAIVAKGLANYRYTGHATAVFEGMIAAMHHFRDRRLPELFCGLAREEGNLVRYPVACSPQAWAAAAPFLFLQSILGIHADATERKLSIRNACLPPSIEWVELSNLRIGQSRVRIRFRRAEQRVHLDALEISGAHLRTEIEHD